MGTRQLEGALLVTAMQTLWRTVYLDQEMPTEDNLKLFWNAAHEEDRQQCAFFVVQLQHNKKKVSYTDRDARITETDRD